jgi:primosomal protein N'
MYVITVIPISRGIGKETLSYFTGSTVELGSLVRVPLRKKDIDALVIGIEDARDMKAQIRSATYTLRKVEKLVSKPFLPEAFMKTVQEVASFHAATIGATLNVLLPKKILAKLSDSEIFHLPSKTSPSSRDLPTSPAKKKTDSKKDRVTEKTVAGTLTERINQYEKLFTDHASTISAVIVVPTLERQRTLKKLFSIPVLLPSALIEIPLDASLIIIEDINAQSYKSISRPFIDFRHALRIFAEQTGASVLAGQESLDPRIIKGLELHVKENDRPFTSVGKYLERDIKRLKETPGHLFILGSRKGHSGTVLCQDCGHSVQCSRCDSPLTLHLKSVKEDYNNLLCHHCGYKTTALMKCEGCGSWRLKAFGLGIEKIEEDVKALCKKHHIDAYIQRLDSTLKLTPKRIRDFVQTHYEKETSILIGTELALPYLVDATLEGHRNTASYVASLDTLLSLPDFSINEKIWRLACQLDDITSERVAIQTRDTNHPLLRYWAKNEEKEFWKQELEERTAFNYPPHGVFIKITVKGKKEKIGREMKAIEEQIKAWKPMIFPAFIKAINNQHILHALVTLPKEAWPNKELSGILLSLSPSVTVEVNPRSLL